MKLNRREGCWLWVSVRVWISLWELQEHQMKLPVQRDERVVSKR